MLVSATVGTNPAAQLLCTSISQSGMFMQTPAPPAKDTMVGVRVELPYGTVVLRGVVRRVITDGVPDRRGFAIEIADIAEGAEAWSGLVRSARVRAPSHGD
jgi:hypothetical protein